MHRFRPGLSTFENCLAWETKKIIILPLQIVQFDFKKKWQAKKKKRKLCTLFVSYFYLRTFVGKGGAQNPTSQYTGICYGVSKTRRECKPAHVRSIINCFVYTGRYQATLRSQVESSNLFSFGITCNLLWGFCTRCMILSRKYGRDIQCM